MARTVQQDAISDGIDDASNTRSHSPKSSKKIKSSSKSSDKKRKVSSSSVSGSKGKRAKKSSSHTNGGLKSSSKAYKTEVSWKTCTGRHLKEALALLHWGSSGRETVQLLTNLAFSRAFAGDDQDSFIESTASLRGLHGLPFIHR